MEKERDMLVIIKERIEKESKYGDKAKACKNASITTTTYDKAINKSVYDKLTDSEELVLLAHISILDARVKKLKMQKKRLYVDRN